jgi:hypothetical protein
VERRRGRRGGRTRRLGISGRVGVLIFAVAIYDTVVVVVLCELVVFLTVDGLSKVRMISTSGVDDNGHTERLRA